MQQAGMGRSRAAMACAVIGCRHRQVLSRKQLQQTEWCTSGGCELFMSELASAQAGTQLLGCNPLRMGLSIGR